MGGQVKTTHQHRIVAVILPSRWPHRQVNNRTVLSRLCLPQPLNQKVSTVRLRNAVEKPQPKNLGKQVQ